MAICKGGPRGSIEHRASQKLNASVIVDHSAAVAIAARGILVPATSHVTQDDGFIR